MTRERKEEVILIALVVSLAVHVGVMAYARPRTMVRMAEGIVRALGRGPMRVTKNVPPPDPVKIGSLVDLEPVRDMPPVKGESAPTLGEMGVVSAIAPERPAPELRPDEQPVIERPVFDVRPISLGTTEVSAKIPMRPIETPTAKDELEASAPNVGMVALPGAMPADIVLPTIGKDPDSVFLPSGIANVKEVRMEPPPREIPKVVKEFKPSEEVYSKVDEKVVETEKAAVKVLVEQTNAAALEKFVNVAIRSSTVGKWTYFKAMVTPRTSLEIIPKDVVIIIDASGSIGKDRMRSIQRAARGILRSMTNSDDRFNLVAFRNRFTYAFRTWQECNRTSFDGADRWIGNLTVFGRTDIFSTIASVLTLPRHPTRPLIAMVVTDGDANYGVSDTAEIISKFSHLNDGLVSVYMYGVKSSANRELIDVLTQGNRGESLIFDGWRWNAGDDLAKLSERFRDPVLSDLRLVFSAETPVETYPQLLKNLYRGETLAFVGRVPKGTKSVGFSLKGLSGCNAYEGFFRLALDGSAYLAGLDTEWQRNRAIAEKLK